MMVHFWEGKPGREYMDWNQTSTLAQFGLLAKEVGSHDIMSSALYCHTLQEAFSSSLSGAEHRLGVLTAGKGNTCI
jgi:hypothetical protein